MLEKKVGGLTVLSRIPKEHPEDVPWYLCHCSCGGFSLLASHTLSPEMPSERRALRPSQKHARSGPDRGASSHLRPPLLTGSDLQCICYSSRLSVMDAPLPAEPDADAPDPFLAERARSGRLKNVHETSFPGLYAAHTMYLPSVSFLGRRHYIGLFISPCYAKTIQQWIRDIRLEKWMDEHRDVIDPEAMRRRLLGVNHARRTAWLNAFDPSRCSDSEYLWKTLCMLSGRQYLYRGTKYMLRFRDGDAVFMQGSAVLQKMSKAEALKGEGLMQPVFAQLGLNPADSGLQPRLPHPQCTENDRKCKTFNEVTL